MAAKKINANTKGRRFKDEQKEKRIQEHLTNKNDEISEEDIRNVRTDIEVFDGDHKGPEVIDVNNDIPHHNLDTPWNLLDEE